MLSKITIGDDERFAAVCRDNGWKRTAQRRAVFNCLCGNREHPSVESVWTLVRTSLPDVSLDSVYRILDDFSGVGLVRRLEGTKVIRYDSATNPHSHFVCDKCSRMYDFEFDASAAGDACLEFGDVDSVEVFVRGVCKDCQ